MSRPPLANLFAMYEAEPTSRRALTEELLQSGEFTEVWQPAPGWVAAAAPLPDSEPDGAFAREQGLAFAEGRDVLCSGGSEDKVRQCMAQIASLADRASEHLNTLPGDFGFIRFRANGQATVVRSCGGLVPFYLWASKERLAVGTRLGDLVRYLADEPCLDPLVNAIWSLGYSLFPDRRSFLADITVLDRGGFAKLDLDRPIQYGCYWNPRPERLNPPTEATAAEHAERLRTLLVNKLTRDLDPKGGNLLTLSGGIDSSSLAALAAGTLGIPISTWSLLPEPEDKYRHEMSFIDPLLKDLAIERRWEVRMEPQWRIEQLRGVPMAVFQVGHPALCDLPRVMSEAPIRVLFGGEFADEVCGSTCTIPDWARHTSLPSLVNALFGTLPSGPRDLLRWTKHRLLPLIGRPPLPMPDRLPGFFRAEVLDEYRTWLDKWRREASYDPRPLRYLTLRAALSDYVPMNWEACSALGVRRSFPFINRQVLELAYECHPAEQLGPGQKKLLRAALQKDVPVKNLNRLDKGGWGVYLRGAQLEWDRALPPLLDRVVKSEWYPRPPAMLEYREARALVLLVGFATRLQGRRHAA